MQALILDFLKVTEAAAISTLPWVGSGDENAADGAATKTMRDQLNKIAMHGTIVIGEGEIDHAPMLYIDEVLGSALEPLVDIAVDPVEGTTPTIKGQSNAMTVIAAAPKGTLLHAPDMYMEKIAVGPRAAGKINLADSLLDNMKAVAKANGKALHELNIYIQDRPRHAEYIAEVRAVGAKVFLFEAGDVVYAVATCIEKLDIDMLVGIGGAPEGVLSAVALQCLGGEIQARLVPRNDEEFNRCIEMGLADPNAVLQQNQLVSSDDCIFAATGITDNLFLQGIKTEHGNHTTHSILINGKDKQLRYVETQHKIKHD